MPDNQTAVISPEGETGYIPVENLQAAVARGFKPAAMVTSPEGQSGMIPRENVLRAVKDRGFTVGQPLTATEASPSRPLTSQWEATKQGAHNIAKGAEDLVSGAVGAFGEANDSKESAIESAGSNTPAGALGGRGLLALYRMAKGAVDTAMAVPQLPGAIKDIAANPQAANYLSNIVGETAGGVAVAAATEGLLRSMGTPAAKTAARTTGTFAKGAISDISATAKTAARTAGKLAKGAISDPTATAETGARIAGKLAKGTISDIPVVRQGLKLGEYAREASKETAARRAPVPESTPPVPESTPPVPEPAPAAKFPQYDKPAPAAAPEPTTAPQEGTAASTAPKAGTTVPKEGTAAPMHPDAAEFEKTFGVPIDNYVDASGKFNTQDFLTEVVKPGEQPVNQVLAKVFGADGVELVKKLNGGKYLSKWESQASAGEPQGGSARLRAKVASQYEGRTVTNEKTGAVSARGFLKKVGADENSILNGAGRTPGEHADSVTYHRGQLRAGTSTPVELHVDESGNVIGADGRHRAMAAIQEHGPDAKVKVKIVKHSFRGVE